MKIAIVAHSLPTTRIGGNVFIAARIAELAKRDEPYGICVKRVDLARWRAQRMVAVLTGRKLRPCASALLFRVLHPRLRERRHLVLSGTASRIGVHLFRYMEHAEAPHIGARSAARIARTLRRKGCDVVHSHFLWYAGIGARIAAVLDVPHVITAHGSDVHQTMRLDERERRQFAQALEAADATIFVSRTLLEEAKSYGYSGGNGRVVHNGYDPAVFYPPGPNEDRRNGRRMLFVGSLTATKGADRLPRILSLVAEAIPDVCLDIVGDQGTGGLGQQVRSEFARAASLRSVTFHGRVEQREVAELMRGSDLLVAPSRSEGFGCAAIEAQACGTPVLGTTTGGLPEAIGDSEATVAQVGDFEAEFARRAIDILRARRRHLRADIASLTWYAVAGEERKIYEEVVARRKVRG